MEILFFSLIRKDKINNSGGFNSHVDIVCHVESWTLEQHPDICITYIEET